MESKTIFYMLIFVTIVFLVVIITQKCMKNEIQKTEAFVDPSNKDFSTLSTSVSDFIRENGFDSVNVLKRFVQGEYNEDLEDILENKTLTLYYSAFSKSSIPVLQNRVWKNTSPYFQDVSETNCKLLSYDNSHLEFSEVPYANKHVGVEMLSNKCYGPPSHLMGIQGNGTFTIFTVIKFNGFSTSNQLQNVYKIYGNTIGNNAINLDIEGVLESKEGKMINIIPKLTYGDNSVILINNNNGNNYFSLDMEKKYMLVLSKKHRNISLTIHDLSKDTIQDSTYTIIKEAEINEVNVLFSNKQMMLNENGNLNANIYAFGVYNMHLLDESTLHHYMYNELYKSTEDFMKDAKQILKFQEEINMLKSCPYDEKVCKECGIDDWTDMEKILYSSENCKKAIDTFCTNNPNNAKCKCWRPENKETAQCKSYVNIFKNERWVNPDKIEKEMLDTIAQKYKLCDCTESEKIKEENKKLEEKVKELQNTRAPTHTLTSPHLPKNAEYNYKTLLDNVDDPNLQPIHQDLYQNIANKQNTYEGKKEDINEFDTTLDSYKKNDNQLLSDKIDPTYGEEIAEPSKGFWAWLFGQ